MSRSGPALKVSRVVAGVEDRHDRARAHDEPASSSRPVSRRGRCGMGEVLVPGGQHARACARGRRECQTIESQSVSSTSSRPPGRSTRWASASAAGDVVHVLIDLGARHGVEARVRERQRGRVRLGVLQRGAARRRRAAAMASMLSLGSMPVTAPFGADAPRHLGREEARARSRCRAPARRARSRARRDRPALADDVRRPVDRLQPPRPGVVELEHRLRSAAPPARARADRSTARRTPSPHLPRAP